MNTWEDLEREAREVDKFTKKNKRCQALKCESKESYGHCPYFYFFPIKHYTSREQVSGLEM